MDVPAVREAMRKAPFEPFTLRLADGRAVLVRHRDFIAVSENGRRIAVFGEDGSLSIIEPLPIVSIEYAPAGQSTPPSGNGA